MAKLYTCLLKLSGWNFKRNTQVCSKSECWK